MAWTDEMVEGLRQMWDEGLTANEIAKRLGVSKNSIVGKVHRLCLKARPSPIKRKDVVEETVRVGDVILRLADTAGLRETNDPIEQIGVERAKKRMVLLSIVLTGSFAQLIFILFTVVFTVIRVKNLVRRRQ